jgi:electron transfer flavoprotein beta subunit
MKIVVPVKQVARLDDDFAWLDDSSGIDPDDIEWDLNEWDTFSLEAAAQLREHAGQGEVVAVTVGAEWADEGLRAALAKGADRAIRIWDEDLTDADPLTVARVLAAAVEDEAADLILCGVQSSDAVNGATGIALAGYLGLSHVAVVKGIELDGSSAIVERELEGGLVELVRISLPALLTIQTGINEPRYATLRAIKQAHEKPLAVLSLDDLGLNSQEVAAAGGSRRLRLSRPQSSQRAEMLDGSTGAVAARIAAIVRERVR